MPAVVGVFVVSDERKPMVLWKVVIGIRDQPRYGPIADDQMPLSADQISIVAREVSLPCSWLPPLIIIRLHVSCNLGFAENGGVQTESKTGEIFWSFLARDGKPENLRSVLLVVR